MAYGQMKRGQMKRACIVSFEEPRLYFIVASGLTACSRASEGEKNRKEKEEETRKRRRTNASTLQKLTGVLC